MLDDQNKKFIDEATYEQLLRRWRFAPTGDNIFQGESGEYYTKVMRERRDRDPAAAVVASKKVGFQC